MRGRILDINNADQVVADLSARWLVKWLGA